MGDISLLADYFLTKYLADSPNEILGFSSRARNLMLRYSWPGNVRELQHAIEKALLQLAQNADPQQVMQRLANEITNKLLHRPTIEMRKALQQGDEERIQLLKSLIAPDPN